MTKEPDDIFVHLINMPDNTSEIVSPNADGTFSIFINARLSNDGQLRAYKHAIKHIKNSDFTKIDVQKIEYEVRQETDTENAKAVPADKYIKELKRIQRKHKKIKKQLEEYESHAQFIYNHFDTFAMAEYTKLYGHDL